MTDNDLTLLCLVDGEATSFPVDIKPTKTVEHLKGAIKAKKAPRFDDIAVDELTLWNVSIPDNDDDDEHPILLDVVPENEKKKLKATHDLADVFDKPPPKNDPHHRPATLAR